MSTWCYRDYIQAYKNGLMSVSTSVSKNPPCHLVNSNLIGGPFVCQKLLSKIKAIWVTVMGLLNLEL